MIKKLLLILNIYSVHIAVVLGICQVLVEPNVIFIQKFGENHMIFRPDETITLREGEKILAFCPSGFVDEYRGPNNLEATPFIRPITCIDGQTNTRLPSEFEYHEYHYQDRSNIQCEGGNPLFYAGDITNCSKTGFYYGFVIKDTPLIFAEICYDIDKMDTVFIHYIASERSPILERQDQYNPTKFVNTSLLIEKATFGSYVSSPRILNEQLETIITSNLQNFAEVSPYKMSELVSLSKSSGSLKKFLHVNALPNMIPWWSTLKKVNWKYYEQLLAQRARRVPLEIYAGKSGVVTYPTQGKCDITESINYEQDSYERQVPKYIWNYIRTVENSGANDIVIIGVNTPFFGLSDLAELSCVDICDNVAWLKQLSKTRKYPAYGYIFCCRPEDVAKSLDGFPQIFSSEPNTVDP